MPKLPAPPANIQLRYAQLEDLVANLLEAHDDRKSSLSARFRLFRQRGFPTDVTALAKTRFAYGLDAVLQATLAFWMMDAFIPQEAIPLVIERDWDKLKVAFRDAFRRIRENPSGAATDERRQVLLLTPCNLQSFKLAKDETGDAAGIVGAKIMSASEAREEVFGDERSDVFAPIIVIDLHRLAAWVREFILTAHWSGPDPFDQFAVD